jgi:hypothetical protein
MLTGVPSWGVVAPSFFERYTPLLMKARTDFPTHFLKVYSSRIPTGMPASCSSSRKVTRCLKFSTQAPEIVFVFDEHGEPEQLPQMVGIELCYWGAAGAEHGEPHQ